MIVRIWNVRRLQYQISKHVLKIILDNSLPFVSTDNMEILLRVTDILLIRICNNCFFLSLLSLILENDTLFYNLIWMLTIIF